MGDTSEAAPPGASTGSTLDCFVFVVVVSVAFAVALPLLDRYSLKDNGGFPVGGNVAASWRDTTNAAVQDPDGF